MIMDRKRKEKRLEEATITSRWWQLKYCFNVHPENWGRFPIGRLHIFSDGLGKNHQPDMELRGTVDDLG